MLWTRDRLKSSDQNGQQWNASWPWRRWAGELLVMAAGADAAAALSLGSLAVGERLRTSRGRALRGCWTWALHGLFTLMGAALSS